MPKNKHALIRYRVINRSLKAKTYVSKEALIRACEEALDISPISERTFAEDIRSMRYDNQLGYFAPIEFDKNKQAYYYSDPDYTIDNIPLNDEEIQSLTFAATLLDQFKEIDIFRKFTGSVQKIVDAVNIHRATKEKNTLDFIDFEKVPYLKGSEYLDVLIKAIRQKKVIHVVYRAFHSEKDHHHDIHPYLLKEYRNRWYLIGLHDYFQKIRIYGLDRIVKIEEVPKKKYQVSNFSPEQYFKNTIGIFSPAEEPPEIILEFNKDAGQYLITQPIHESQQIVSETNEKITFSFKVHPTVEMIQLILGRGSDVKVIEPQSLQDEIITKVHELMKLY